MKKNVASQAIGAQMVAAATGAAFTSTVTVRVTGDNGSQALGANSSPLGLCVHEGNGYHSYTPTQAETNYDHISFTFTGTGAVPASVQVYTVFPQTGDSFVRLGAPAGASVSADVAAVKVDTAATLADTGTDGVVVAAASKTGYTLAATTGLGNQTANITGNLSGSVGSVTGAVGSVTGAVGSVTGHTPQTGDSFARIGAPAGASVSADVAAVKVDTAATLVDTAVIGALGAGLTGIPWNAAWDAEVQSEVQDAIEANHLDHLLAVTYDPASKPGTADALLNELVENDGGVSRYTVNALENAPSGTGASAASIADAVWDEAQADHVGAGTFGVTASEIADILVDTAVIGALGAGLTGVPWNAAWDAEVQSEVQDAIEVNHLDHLLAADYDPASKPGVATALLNEIVENDAGVSRFTVNALENAPSGTGASAETIADAVWDELQSGHVGAGTFGEVATEVAAVLADTGTDGVVVAAASKAGYALTATTGLGNQTANITGNLSGSVGSVTGAVGSVTGAVGSVTGAVGSVTAERGKYADGSVWIGPAANTNTVSYVDGIITNPVSTLAAAKTIADALGLRRFYTIRTGTVQVGADYVGYDFAGNAWSLTTTGGSRDVSSSTFLDAKVVGGTFASTSAESHWDHCEFSTGVTVAALHATECTFQGTLTLSAAGQYDFVDCASVVAGTGAPVFEVPAGVVNISFRRWSGGISITGITADTVISIDVVSGGTVTLAGVGGNVQVRGLVAGITDNRTGTPTLGQNAAVNITKINTEADTALSDYDPPTNAEMEARTIAAANYATAANLATVDGIVDNILLDTAEIGTAGAGLTALSTAAALATVDTVVDNLNLGIIYGAAATGTLSTTQASTNLTGYANDQLIGRVVIFTSGACEGEASDITDYVETAGVLTFTALTAAPGNGDTFKIV